MLSWWALQKQADPSYLRELRGDITNSLIISVFYMVIPIIRVLQLKNVLQNLSLTLAEVINDTTSAVISQGRVGLCNLQHLIFHLDL